MLIEFERGDSTLAVVSVDKPSDFVVPPLGTIVSIEGHGDDVYRVVGYEMDLRREEGSRPHLMEQRYMSIQVEDVNDELIIHHRQPNTHR